MAGRILFNVIYATSEHPAHPACELNAAGPASVGWRSGVPSGCNTQELPHELLLRLQVRSRLHSVQLLAHHQLIPKCVELLVYDPGAGAGAVTPCGAAYTAVGSLELRAPPLGARDSVTAVAATGLRELRTARLPEPYMARFLKLRISGPHEGSATQQVALMAINILGVMLSDDAAETADTGPMEFSPYDDLAFVMYVDPQVADIIRELDVKSQLAIDSGLPRRAAAMRAAGRSLSLVGQRVGRWRLRQRAAAAAERYEEARSCRDRANDAIRAIRDDRRIRLWLDGFSDTEDSDELNNPETIDFSINLDLPVTTPSAPSPTVEPSRTCNETLDPLFRNQHEIITQSSGPPEEILEEVCKKHREVDGRVKVPNINYEELKENTLRNENKHQIKSENNDYCNKTIEKAQSKIGNPENIRFHEAETRRYTGARRYSDTGGKISHCETFGTQSPKEYPNRSDTNMVRYEENEFGEKNPKKVDLYDEKDPVFGDNKSYGLGKVLFSDEHDAGSPRHRKDFEDGDYPSDRKLDSLRWNESNCGVKRLSRMEDVERSYDSPERSVTPTTLITRNGTDSPRNTNGIRRRHRSAGRTSYDAYEERRLPAHTHTNEYMHECQSGPESSSDPRSAGNQAATKLNEREKKMAALPILIFGNALVEKFYSKHFVDKEEALRQLRTELQEFGARQNASTGSRSGNTATASVAARLSPNKTARAAATLLQKALRDKVFSVYSLATEVVREFFAHFVTERVCAAETLRCIERILPELLTRAGDPAPRVHATATHTILSLSECPPVRALHIIAQQLVLPVSAATRPRLALSRLQMVQQMLLTQGISTDKNSGMTVRRLSELGASGAAHACGAVRREAARVLLAAYARSPRAARAQLPPDDAVTRRSPLYRHLYEQFDRIDAQKMLGQTPTMEQLFNMSRYPSDMVSSGTFTDSLANAAQSSDLMTASSTTLTVNQTVNKEQKMIQSLHSTLNHKSNLKKTPSKYTANASMNNLTSNYGYNKLRLDSAVSPKHTPKRTSPNYNKNTEEEIPFHQNDKVHFDKDFETKTRKSADRVVLRHANRNQDYRHSMIDYNDKKNPEIKERPLTICDPLQYSFDNLGFKDLSASIYDSKSSLSQSKEDVYGNSDGSRSKGIGMRDSYRDLSNSPSVLEGDRMGTLRNGVKNMQLEDSHTSLMEESGYYSPVDSRSREVLRTKSGSNSGAGALGISHNEFESFDDSLYDGSAVGASGDDTSVRSDATTPDITLRESCEEGEGVGAAGVGECGWCGASVAALDAHYWRECPLLVRCARCRHVVEALAYDEHLVEVCRERALFVRCARCGDALPQEFKRQHDSYGTCQPVRSGHWRCPHCRCEVTATEESWRHHLTGSGVSTEQPCLANPRSVVLYAKTFHP